MGIKDFMKKPAKSDQIQVEKPKIVEPIKSITPEYLSILKDPELFKKINKEFDKKIAGEEKTRKVIFLCCQGRLVENCQRASYNCILNDDAGTGKDYTGKAVCDILPKGIFIHKTRITPTVFTYWHNPKFEPEWTWDGKVFFAEDISESTLNSEVFKVMSSSGSSATIVIKQVVYDIDIKGKPVIFTSTATSTPSPELVRRNLILNLDSTEKQTQEILKKHSKFKVEGIIPEYDEKLIEAQSFLKRVKVKIPFAEKLDPCFPSQNVMMRTNYPRFLDFISASAAFHQYQRKIDSKDFVIAQEEDYEIARDCFLAMNSNAQLIAMTRTQKKILEIFQSSIDLNKSASALFSEELSQVGLTLKHIMANLQILVNYGFLKTKEGIDSRNRDITLYSLNLNFLHRQKFTLPKFLELK